MNNKNYKLLFLPFVVLAIVLTCATSCKKDSEYYNYENTIKEFDGTALKYIQDQKGTYDSMLVVLDLLPDLKDTLANENVTFFAVTNKSFEAAIKNLNIERKAQSKAPIYLRNADLLELDTLMSRYIIKGSRTTDVFKPFAEGILLASVKHGYPMHIKYDKLNASGFLEGGPQSIIFSDPKNSIFQKFWESTPTNAVNIRTKNAVINILAPSHDFGFNEFVKRINK